jgi:hypothetical protein
MSVVDRSFDHPLKLEERAAGPLAGGLMMQGYQCGQLWGAALAAGVQAYRLLGPTPEAEAAAVRASQRLVESFRAGYGEIYCAELTEMAWKKVQARQVLRFLLRGGPIRCFGMSASYASTALGEINRALGEPSAGATARPVSCSALLAKKVGASDMHCAMAAGFAGGIGLSGGACGALGAAIWIIGTKAGKENIGAIGYQNPGALAAIDRFLASSDYEFECSTIVGRRFDDVDDHAGYLRDGGCSTIIEALAACIRPGSNEIPPERCES